MPGTCCEEGNACCTNNVILDAKAENVPTNEEYCNGKSKNVGESMFGPDTYNKDSKTQVVIPIIEKQITSKKTPMAKTETSDFTNYENKFEIQNEKDKNRYDERLCHLFMQQMCQES